MGTGVNDLFKSVAEKCNQMNLNKNRTSFPLQKQVIDVPANEAVVYP